MKENVRQSAGYGHSAGRRVVLASADAVVRERLRTSLTAMRWQVFDAAGGAEAMARLEEAPQDALLLDGWLPDLEANEFARSLHALYPALDVLRLDGNAPAAGPKSQLRHELLQALREAQSEVGPLHGRSALAQDAALTQAAERMVPGAALAGVQRSAPTVQPAAQFAAQLAKQEGLEGIVGSSAPMRELARLVRLVAPQPATVLIEGETGTGKELVAQAVHRLSRRAGRSFTVLNCAAIPESLLEAELFGHARGAFTGAVQARTGRMEAAHGGTLFLDEIGEMPVLLQAKLLRFLENGELQRVGDNEVLRVDVRVIAATHRQLEQNIAQGTFRLDLYHRLAVFPLEVPPLRARMEDIPALAEHFLERLGRLSPRKHLGEDAQAALCGHPWPGNVRELAHVLERATILAGASPLLGAEHIRMRHTSRGPSA